MELGRVLLGLGNSLGREALGHRGICERLRMREENRISRCVSVAVN